MDRDPHFVLGLAPGATRDEVRSAWRSASKRLHPDLGGDAAAFREAFEAYQALLHGPHQGDYGDEVRWPSDVLVVDGYDDSWAWWPSRSLLRPVAIGLILVVTIAILLMPAVLAAAK